MCLAAIVTGEYRREDVPAHRAFLVGDGRLKQGRHSIRRCEQRTRLIGELQLQHDLASLADSRDGHLRELELAL
jgi:hypothetical protein